MQAGLLLAKKLFVPQAFGHDQAISLPYLLCSILNSKLLDWLMSMSCFAASYNVSATMNVTANFPVIAVIEKGCRDSSSF